MLRGQNEDTSGGDYSEGKTAPGLPVAGQFRQPEQVEQQLLAIRDGNPVYVRDVAEVQLGYKKADGLVRRFGESSIAVNALRETGANVLMPWPVCRPLTKSSMPDCSKRRAAIDASLRRNRVHLFVHDPGTREHFCWRCVDDDRLDDLLTLGVENPDCRTAYRGNFLGRCLR